MKDHFCSIEKEWIGYEGQCNWCGEKELLPKRTWIGLTDEEIERDYYGRHDFVRAIELRIKEKNT